MTNFDGLLRPFGERLLRIYANFTRMHRKDLDVAILQTHMDATHLQIDIKTVQTDVAKVSSSTDFQESPSSDLIIRKTFRTDVVIC